MVSKAKEDVTPSLQPSGLSPLTVRQGQEGLMVPKDAASSCWKETLQLAGGGAQTSLTRLLAARAAGKARLGRHPETFVGRHPV